MKKAVPVLSWLLLLTVLVGSLLFFDRNIDLLLDSDMSSELVYSNLIHNEGTFLSTNWYYSTELRILNTQLLFAPLFGIFQSWHTVRVVGAILLYLFMLASAYYLCAQVSIQRFFPLVGILLLTPLSWPFFKNIQRGLHYIPYITQSFLLLALLFHSIHVRRKGARAALLTVLGILSLLVGMGGPRHILLFFVPIVLASAFLCLYGGKGLPEPSVRENKRFLVSASLAAACAVVGYLINMLVLSHIYSYNTNDLLLFTTFNLENLVAVIQEWLTFFGYMTGEAFSSVLLFNLLSALLALIVLVTVVRSLRRPDASVEHKILAAFYTAAYAVYLLLYSFTTQTYHPTYQIPIAVFGFFVIAVWFQTESMRTFFTRAVSVAVSVLLLFCMVRAYGFYTEEDATERLDMRCDPYEFPDIVETVLDEGYTRGYSTFWVGGNVLTELSDGAIEMWVWPNQPVGGIDDIHPWLQAKSHSTQPPEGPFFLMFQTNQLDVLEASKNLESADLLYYSDQYVVYGFESREAYDEIHLGGEA